MPAISTIQDAIERLYALNVGVIGQGSARHERPHKPVLLLATLDLIAEGSARPDRVEWSNELRQRFTLYFSLVKKANDDNTPDNPFLRLRKDKFWEPLVHNGRIERPLDSNPTAAQAGAGGVFARFCDGMEQFVSERDPRMRLRDALISRFFPTERTAITPLFEEVDLPGGNAREGEAAGNSNNDDGGQGRNPAFRRKVLEVYDYQCAACGLRIKLPESDLTFVDGAHIIPFNKSRNDHPSNGLALCKNHHWAMDRFLIVPTPEGVWKASPRLIARRSPGEEALLALQGQPVLPPHDEAYMPDPASLAWRSERLYA